MPYEIGEAGAEGRLRIEMEGLVVKICEEEVWRRRQTGLNESRLGDLYGEVVANGS